MAERQERGLYVFVAIVSLFAVFAASCGGDSTPSGATPTAAPSPTATVALPVDAPEDTLRAWARGHLSQAFLSDCSLADRPDDVGKLCATLIEQRNGVLAYGLGPTFSEYTRLFLLRPIDGVWSIIYEETTSLDSIPWPLEVGATVVVSVDDDCLQIRDQPGLAAVSIDCLADGTLVTISAGPTARDGFEWWRLRDRGWAAGDWLRYPATTPVVE